MRNVIHYGVMLVGSVSYLGCYVAQTLRLQTGGSVYIKQDFRLDCDKWTMYYGFFGEFFMLYLVARRKVVHTYSHTTYIMD